jgi:hypothetical protein
MNRSTAVWLHGLLAALIGGGASAVTSTFTASMFAPDKFNLSSYSGFLHVIGLIIATFVANGLLAAFFYLKSSPLPDSTWDGMDRRDGRANAATIGS